jgi:hypothetical protein
MGNDFVHLIDKRLQLEALVGWLATAARSPIMKIEVWKNFSPRRGLALNHIFHVTVQSILEVYSNSRIHYSANTQEADGKNPMQRPRVKEKEK